jgi:hypothetical protein
MQAATDDDYKERPLGANAVKAAVMDKSPLSIPDPKAPLRVFGIGQKHEAFPIF